MAEQVLSPIIEVDDILEYELEGGFDNPAYANIKLDIFQYDQGQRRQKQVARCRRQQERKQKAIQLRGLGENLAQNGIRAFKRQVWHIGVEGMQGS